MILAQLPQSIADTVTRALLFAVVCLAAALYATGLDRVPIHLHHDEVYFGMISHSLSQTWRDPNGRLLPILFQMGDSHHWYPPILIYFTALWLKLLPLSDAAVRLPNAVIGVANVVLIYFVAQRMFRDRWLALAAAAILAATPAHFINSRIATDCLYPVAFILAWLLLLLRYLETPTRLRLFAAMSVLGVGVYSYIASVVMMPIYALMTAAVLWRERRLADSWPGVAGFAWPMLFGVGFLAVHPTIVADYMKKYQLADGTASLNLFQQLRDTLTPWNISDHLNLFHSSFAPGYLFVTGGSNIAHSTRLAGVFLAPLAVLLIVGIVDVIRRPTTVKLLVLAGFVTAPLAATLVPEDFAVPRMLGLLPFGVLLSIGGLARLAAAPLGFSPRLLTTVAGVAVAGIGAAYATLMLIRQGHLSSSAVVMIAAGIATWMLGVICDRRRSWQPVAIVLLLLMPAQFAVFAADYFGDYRARSAARYGYNIRGAIEQAIAVHDRSPGVPFYFNDDTLFIRAYWDYYLRVFKRTELLAQAVWFNSEHGLPHLDPGTIVVTNVSDRVKPVLASVPGLVVVGEATDPVPGTNPPEDTVTFLILQKR